LWHEGLVLVQQGAVLRIAKGTQQALLVLGRCDQHLQGLIGVPVNPVVKADGYGLGAAAVARRLMTEGARTFFVARAAAGVALREALGAEPVIYVLDGCHGASAGMIKAANLRPVLNQPGQIAAWTAAAGFVSGIVLNAVNRRRGLMETGPWTDPVVLRMAALVAGLVVAAALARAARRRPDGPRTGARLALVSLGVLTLSILWGLLAPTKHGQPPATDPLRHEAAP
jgi:hypothetical protein